MGLDKAIAHGKEHRKPHTGSKAIDATCRNHGSCLYCEGNRKHKFRDKYPADTYEQICEQILEKQDMPDKVKIWFQVNILDKAQNVFEEHNVHY